jgi:transposase
MTDSEDQDKPAVIPRHRLHARHVKRVREIVVYQNEILGWNSTQIAIALDIPLRSVQRMLQRWKELGEVLDDPKQAGRPRLMNDHHIDVR